MAGTEGGRRKIALYVKAGNRASRSIKSHIRGPPLIVRFPREILSGRETPGLGKQSKAQARQSRRREVSLSLFDPIEFPGRIEYRRRWRRGSRVSYEKMGMILVTSFVRAQCSPKVSTLTQETGTRPERPKSRLMRLPAARFPSSRQQEKGNGREGNIKQIIRKPK